jgi:hypothetical protein
MKRSGEKGGRKSARKAQRLSRSKPSHIPSVLPSVELQVGESVLVTGIIKSIDKNRLCEVSILDPSLPKVVDVWIWPRSLKRSALWRSLDYYDAALRDLLAFYDRATGQSVDHSGYTSADVLRIEEIRKLAAGGRDLTDPTSNIQLPASRNPIPGVFRPSGSQTALASYGKPGKPRKIRQWAS